MNFYAQRDYISNSLRVYRGKIYPEMLRGFKYGEESSVMCVMQVEILEQIGNILVRYHVNLIKYDYKNCNILCCT